MVSAKLTPMQRASDQAEPRTPVVVVVVVVVVVAMVIVVIVVVVVVLAPLQLLPHGPVLRARSTIVLLASSSPAAPAWASAAGSSKHRSAAGQ